MVNLKRILSKFLVALMSVLLLLPLNGLKVEAEPAQMGSVEATITGQQSDGTVKAGQTITWTLVSTIDPSQSYWDGARFDLYYDHTKLKYENVVTTGNGTLIQSTNFHQGDGHERIGFMIMSLDHTVMTTNVTFTALTDIDQSNNTDIRMSVYFGMDRTGTYPIHAFSTRPDFNNAATHTYEALGGIDSNGEIILPVVTSKANVIFLVEGGEWDTGGSAQITVEKELPTTDTVQFPDAGNMPTTPKYKASGAWYERNATGNDTPISQPISFVEGTKTYVYKYDLAEYGITYAFPGTADVDYPSSVSVPTDSKTDYHVGDTVTVAPNPSDVPGTKGGQTGTWKFKEWDLSVLGPGNTHPGVSGGTTNNLVINGTWEFEADPVIVKYTYQYYVDTSYGTWSDGTTDPKSEEVVENEYPKHVPVAVLTAPHMINGHWEPTDPSVTPATQIMEFVYTWDNEPQYGVTYNVTDYAELLDYDPSLEVPVGTMGGNYYAGDRPSVHPVAPNANGVRPSDGKKGQWVFSGWTPNVAISIDSSGEFTMPSEPVVFNGSYTFYEEGTYNVSYTFTGDIPAGVNVPMDNNPYYVNDPVTLPTIASPIDITSGPKQGTYTFEGWTVGGSPVTGTVPMANGGLSVTGNWSFVEAAKYDVVYSFENAPATWNPTNLPATQGYYAGSSVTLDGQAYGTDEEKQGSVWGTWKFDGWTRAESASGPVAISGGAITSMPAEQVVVYGTWSFTPEVITYTYTAGTGSVYTKGSNATLNFTVNRSRDDNLTFEKFREIKVNGSPIPASAYDTSNGSLKHTLKSSYLESLASGTYTLEAVFEDGSATSNFKVQDKVTPKPTPTPTSTTKVVTNKVVEYVKVPVVNTARK